MSEPADKRRPPILATAIGLALAIGLTALAAPSQPLFRAGNIAVSTSSLPTLFLMHHPTEPGHAYLVQRRGSTMRRDDNSQDGAKRTLLTFTQAPEQRPSYILLNNKLGTVALLPIESLEDWSYPFLHAFIAARHPDWPLAGMRLCQLHVDRLYRGLYVELQLPHDPTKSQGGDGSLRKLLDVHDFGTVRLNTRFDDGSGALMAHLVLGHWPASEAAPSEILFLQRLRLEAGDAGSTYVLDADEKTGKARLSPTWWSLGDLYSAAHGRDAARVEDGRFVAWVVHRDPDGQPPSPSFDDATRAELRRAWQRYLPALVQGLVLDAEVSGRPVPDAETLQRRLHGAWLAGLDAPVAEASK